MLGGDIGVVGENVFEDIDYCVVLENLVVLVMVE